MPTATAAADSPSRASAVLRGSAASPIARGEREKEREDSREQQLVLQELRMRAQYREPSREREHAERPEPSVANAAHEHPERERRERAHEELSVVAGRHVRRDRTAHHVGESAEQRRIESESPRAQEVVREQPGQKDVHHEADRHRDVGRHDHAQQEGRVENVAVHRGDVRQATVDVRVPERERARGAQRVRGELAERVAGEVLIAVDVDQELPGERGRAEPQRRERVHERAPEAGEARRADVGRRFSAWGCVLLHEWTAGGAGRRPER